MDTRKILAIILLSLSIKDTIVNGYKILHFPIPLKSHVIVIGRFAEALATHGHEAHLLLPSHTTPANDLAQSKVKTIYYPVSMNQTWANSRESNQMEMRMVELSQGNIFQNLYEGMGYYRHGGHQLNRECEELFNSSHIIARLAGERYDLIVLDSAHIALCTPMLAYKLDIPVIILSTTNTEWFYRFPRSSAIPSIITDSTDKMTFTERFTSFFKDMVEHLLFLNSTTYYSERYVPEKPPKSAMDIDREALFIFGLYDPVLLYPRPMMPNTIDVGDLMIRSGKPLAKDFADIMENSMGDVIIMSFGTMLWNLPQEILDKFCYAFRNLDPNVTILWQAKLKQCENITSNVIFKPWLPLNDLLAHQHVKLLITHAGLNSYVEAVNHGKPMIAFPLSLDRPRYAVAIEEKGLGIRMNILDFTGKELLDNINKILNTDSYAKKVRMISERMKKRYIQHVDERIAFWVEHVVAYGAEHLRTGTFQLTLVEFLMVDVYFVIFMVLVFALITMLYLSCCVVKLTFARISMKQKID